MNFVFKKPKINGVISGSCTNGHIHIKKEDKAIPKIPEFKDKKVADKLPKEPEWKPIHDAADEQTKDMINQIIKAAEETKKNTNKSEMVKAARDGDRNRLERAIPFERYNEQLSMLEENIRFTFNKAGAAMIIHLPPQFRGLVFDSTTPRARKIVMDRGADLVIEIGEGTRNAIRREIDKAFKEGLGADRTADNIINLIGLTERQAGAVTKFRQTALENGASIARAKRDAKEYADRLLKYRAETIARTELMKAANEGHLEMVRQGIDQGVIPNRPMVKVWIVAPDDRLCEWCAPMDEQRVSIDDFFMSGLGNVESPPLHPNCRCVISVEFENL